jgi:hypothetical protein
MGWHHSYLVVITTGSMRMVQPLLEPSPQMMNIRQWRCVLARPLCCAQLGAPAAVS